MTGSDDLTGLVCDVTAELIRRQTPDLDRLCAIHVDGLKAARAQYPDTDPVYVQVAYFATYLADDAMSGNAAKALLMQFIIREADRIGVQP